jgi:hypothetical protein
MSTNEDKREDPMDAQDTDDTQHYSSLEDIPPELRAKIMAALADSNKADLNESNSNDGAEDTLDVSTATESTIPGEPWANTRDVRFNGLLSARPLYNCFLIISTLILFTGMS